MPSTRGGSVRKRNRTGGVVYQARYLDSANNEHTRTFKLKADADKFLRDQLTKLDKGEWIDPTEGKRTLEDWCAQWLASDPSKRATTLARDRTVLKTHWLPPLGNRPVGSLVPADVQAVVKVMVSKLAPRTVTTNYGVFRACMNAAVEAELTARTPCRGVKLPKVDVHEEEIRFLERYELDRLADAVPQEYRAMIYVAGVMGLRWSEIAGLRVGRVDFLKRTLTVAETMAEVGGVVASAPVKTKASRRTLAIPPFLVEMLAEHLARTERTTPDVLVFQGRGGGPLRAANFRNRIWAQAIKTAELPGLTFHGLRHTAVGFMIALGYQAAVIQKRMGHASIRTTMDVYGHLLPSADEAVADGLDALFLANVVPLHKAE